MSALRFGSRRSCVYGRKGMVASSQPYASGIGLDILKKGGNAVDAAIGIAAALAVTEPCSTGLGGDCFLLYFDSKTRKVHSINGSGRCPAALDLKTAKQHMSGTYVADDSIHAVTVPGAAAGWADAIEKFGTMSLEAILEPAAQIAEDGFPLSEITAHSWQAEEFKLRRGVNCEELLIDNRPPKCGEVFCNLYMAQTLRELGQGGKEAFYKGRVGKEIVSVLSSMGGLMTMKDLEDHVSTFPEPISTTYRDMELYECAPNGQGLAALLGVAMLENARIKNEPLVNKEKPRETLHNLVEVVRLAFGDARRHVADPEFASVPVKALLSPDYIEKRRKLISPDTVIPDELAGTPFSACDTVSFQVVDAEGNAVSMVNSNYEGFGSGIIPKGCGFTLQNRGANFSLEEGHPNVLAPCKRPYHTIIPALLLHKDTQELFSTFTSMGGFAQPQSHIQLVVNLLEYGMNPQVAIDEPRFCIFDGAHNGEIFFEEGFSEQDIEALKAMGHKVGVVKEGGGSILVSGHSRAIFGRSQIIIRDRKTGVLCGGSDGRADGVALGY